MDKIRILLVDDHVLFREGLRELLEHEEDLECVAIAGNGAEAIKLARELLPDVALIDIAMPEMDGIELAEQVRLACPTTAILMLSAYKHDNYVRASMRVGVDGYLLKTTPPRELINAIRFVHTGGNVFKLGDTREVMRRVFTAGDKEQLGSNELQNRELEILKLAARGMSNKMIGSELCLSTHTVRTHLGNIFRKLGVESRTEAMSHALKQGLLTVADLSSERSSD